jgi:hypothetical protein
VTEKKEAASYRIIGLEAENVKRIKAVSIKPDGSVVEISGRNGQGKSSLLDAIWWALAEAKHIQDVPVRQGADRAVIKLDLGKLKVTRTIRAPKTEGGEFTTSLKVENEEGAAYSSPQKMLDALVGGLSFDPLEFTRMKPEAQFNACRRFVPDFDFDANTAKRKAVFEERTGINRLAKDLNAQAEGVVVDLTAAGLLRVDEAELVSELERAGQHNADIEKRRGNRENAQAKIMSDRERADDLLTRARQLREDAERSARALEDQASELQALAAETQGKLNDAPPLPDPINTELLTTQIAAARETNARIDTAEAAARNRADLIKRAGEAEAKAAALTGDIESLDKAKADAIRSAKMPVAGLSFGDGVVLLDGLPLNQASGAAQLRLSCAIAAALNPKLRVLRVKDGALLDQDSMTLLSEFAESNDMQIWIETVASGRPGAIVIEDGMVKAAAADQVAGQ